MVRTIAYSCSVAEGTHANKTHWENSRQQISVHLSHVGSDEGTTMRIGLNYLTPVLRRELAGPG
jgi:hypothetical protein